MKKILEVHWFTPGKAQGIIGIVLVREDGELKAYIGIAEGVDEELDKVNIAEWGSHFPMEATKGLFFRTSMMKPSEGLFFKTYL